MNIRIVLLSKSYSKLFYVFAFAIFHLLWSIQTANAGNNEKFNFTYEDAISQCGLSGQHASMKLAVFLYIPERDAIFANDQSLKKACERLNKEGTKCYMAKPVPIIETKYVLGEFCHTMKEGGADFSIDDYRVKLSYHDPKDKRMHQIFVQFEKFNENTLLVQRITYDDGRKLEGQEAGFMLLWFFNPSAI